jgi:hypothetical protein
MQDAYGTFSIVKGKEKNQSPVLSVVEKKSEEVISANTVHQLTSLYKLRELHLQTTTFQNYQSGAAT